MRLRDFTLLIRPRVTPDPSRAAELEQRFQRLSYQPQVAFHRDRLQPRISDTLPSLLRKQAS